VPTLGYFCASATEIGYHENKTSSRSIHIVVIIIIMVAPAAESSFLRAGLDHSLMEPNLMWVKKDVPFYATHS
jgi:hypothetical protein